MVNEELVPQTNNGENRFISQAPQGPGIPFQDHYGDLISKQSGPLSGEMVKGKEKE